jgi:hypothetical protein
MVVEARVSLQKPWILFVAVQLRTGAQLAVEAQVLLQKPRIQVDLCSCEVTDPLLLLGA